MKIYTKNGDTGKTSLLNERVSKTNIRIEANGQIDELMVMFAYLVEDLKANDEEELYYDIRKIYKNLFTITSMIADVKNQYDYSLKDKDILNLENDIDLMTEQLPKLKNFIYYTGCKTSILCHQIRAKVRSVERTADRIYETEALDHDILIYLNRLSDYFYTLARYINFKSGNEEDILKM